MPINLRPLACCIALTVFSLPAFAAQDGFGNERISSPFSNSSQSAFGDADADAAASIAPAAGETTRSDIKVESAAPEADKAPKPQPVTDAKGRAQDSTAKAGQELEKKYGDGADRQVIDRGTGQTETQDTYGGDTVNVFQRETDHGRVMDKDTAAGVSVKVLEFK
jgi:hypothetical protein